jgi:hypothetical protein
MPNDGLGPRKHRHIAAGIVVGDSCPRKGSYCGSKYYNEDLRDASIEEDWERKNCFEAHSDVPVLSGQRQRLAQFLSTQTSM